MATKRVAVESISSYFESPTDPRHTRNRKHLFLAIVVIAVCGLVCGCDGPTAIRHWAANRSDWLKGFLKLPNGIPPRVQVREPKTARCAEHNTNERQGQNTAAAHVLPTFRSAEGVSNPAAQDCRLRRVKLPLGAAARHRTGPGWPANMCRTFLAVSVAEMRRLVPL